MTGDVGAPPGGIFGAMGEDARVDVGCTDGPVGVLLVDDNQQWAEFIAADLEKHDPRIDVSVALSVNEATLALQEANDIDCVVTDYQMPEIDGLQFLERIRDEWPGLPFILVTGQGSEDVASKAIDAGVTDYLVKDPRADQTAIFADKIRSAVTQYRLNQSVQESEQRYRTVTEQSRDAIVIVQGGRLVFWNHRLCELTGLDDAQLSSVTAVTDLVYEEDRSRMASLVAQWDESDESVVYEVRFVTANGAVRDCTITGGSIVYQDPAILLSIRDVTERKRRERQLAWERNLNRTVQQVLIESRTRKQLEAAIAELLCEHGYAMAWFGEVTDGELVPRVIEGDDSYVDALELTMEQSVHDHEPSLWAARTNESQFVQHFTDLFETAWQQSAIEHDYHSGGAVPVRYNEISYGVLAVYHDAPGRFDDAERDLLDELGETVGFAIHNIGTEVALASDHAVTAAVTLGGTVSYLTDIVRSAPFRRSGASVTVRGTIPYEEGFLQYVTLDGTDPETFMNTVTEQGVDVDITVIDEDHGRLQVQVSSEQPQSMLAQRGVVVRSTTVRPGGTTLTLELPAKNDLRAIVDELKDEFERAEVQSVFQTDANHEEQTGTELTAKQSAALQAAYHHGYFEQPRKNSASNVAAALDIAHSTFLQHLRTAQQKLFEPRFE